MFKLSVAFCAVLLTSACATYHPEVMDQAKLVQSKGTEYKANPVRLAHTSRVVEVDGPLLSLTEKAISADGWLKNKKITLKVQNPISLQEVFKAFAKDGVNIVSDLPLDRYVYSGLSFSDVTAETALRIVLGSAGLDYTLDGTRHVVRVRPLSSKTWFLNIGNRKATYASGTQGQGGGQNAPSPQQSQNTTGTQTGSTSMAPTGTLGGTPSGSSSVSSTEDFWKSLQTELESRMKLLMPDMGVAGVAQAALPPPLPAIAGAQQGTVPETFAAQPAVGSSTGTYTSKQMGMFSLNPETGAVTVQAPHWILSEIDSYMVHVQDMYNTDLTFTGELIAVSLDSDKSEGIDLTAFASAIRDTYGNMVGISNNALGGITLSGLPDTASSLAGAFTGKFNTGNQSLGAQVSRTNNGRTNALQLFNSYLSTLGTVSVLQHPTVTTTSGIPGDFKRTTTKYYNTVTQQAANGGTGAAAIGTVNQLVPIELGTILRINPRIDLATGLIRAQITLDQTTQTGTQQVSQSLTSGTTVQQVVTPIPILAKISYSGEALLKDGDVIVMGGQMEDTAGQTHNGVTELMDSPGLSGIFSQKRIITGKTVFYFALKVAATKRK